MSVVTGLTFISTTKQEIEMARPTRVRWAGVGAMIGAALLIAACSSSGGNPTISEPTTTTDTASSGGPASSDGGGTGQATGSTIKVGLAYTKQTTATQPAPEMAIAADAGIKWINSHGGANGHKVELVKCDDHFTAAGASSCLRQFADDKSIIAILGGDNCFLDASAALFKSSGLPWLAAGACSPLGYTSPQVTQVNGGPLADSAALGGLVGRAKSTGAIFTFNMAQSQAVVDAAVDAAAKSGGKVVPVLTDPTATDMTSYVSTALRKNVDAMIPETSSAQIAGILQALKQQDFKGKIYASETQLQGELLKNVGSQGDSIIGVSTSTPADVPGVTLPAVTQFTQEMKAEGASDNQLNLAAFGQWLVMHQFYDSVKDLSTFDRPSVLKAVKSLKDWSYEQATPPLDFSAPGPFSKYPNVIMHWYAALTVVDGHWSWDGKWVDFSADVS